MIGIGAMALLAATTLFVALSACGTGLSDSDIEELSGLAEPFEIAAYRDLRPQPEIRSIDLRIDTGFDEREKLPRDAISPIYTPKYIPASESNLIDDALVMGIEINGEARAMPVGLMRFREMVNDEIGGVPILATWRPLCYTGLVHDRRIGGKVYTFGNEGALFKGAMTWWDWETSSIWSQPWGAAIAGELEGQTLVLLPVEVLTFGGWKTRHPETLVLIDERNESFEYAPQPAANTFVLGVDIGGDAVGYYFGSVAKGGVVNHRVGRHDVTVWADWKTREGHIFLREPRKLKDGANAAPGVLTFSSSESERHITDDQTGSLWDVETGISVAGPLAGNVLQRVPFISSFDWAWEDFYPDSEFYGYREDRGP